MNTLEQYDFHTTLTRLDDIDKWLNSRGIKSHNRVRAYRRNIQDILDTQAKHEIGQFQTNLSIERARERFWSYIEADEFVRAVDALRSCFKDEVPGAPITKALNGPADLFLENADNNRGRNFMFELVIGGRLAAAGFHPSFDSGPDVHFEFANLQVAVQCKRPLSTKAFEKTIGKGIAQLKADRADLGLIAVSVSRILNAGDPNQIHEVSHPEMARGYVQDRLLEIAQQTQRLWSGRLENAGILFYAFIPICSSDGMYWPTRSEALFPLRPNGVTSTLLESLAKSLIASPAKQPTRG